MSEEVDCLVPAAGRSKRMGDWKPLLPFERSTIIETVVTRALEACPRVILVTGYRAAELAALFDGRPRVRVVENADWPRGMFSSIQRGVSHVETPRFFVTLGDMPWIGAEVYRALLGCPAADMIFPTREGQRGHPVIVDTRLLPDILAADPATGSMREIAGRVTVRELPWADDSILRDIDTEEDLRARPAP